MEKIKILKTTEDRYNSLVDEYKLLLECYQCANNYERRIVWAVLDKYAKESEDETP